MKRHLTTLLFVLFSSLLSGQNAFYEAKKLTDAFNRQDPNAFFQVLADQPEMARHYQGSTVTYADIYSFYGGDELIKAGLDQMLELKEKDLKTREDALAKLQRQKIKLVNEVQYELAGRTVNIKRELKELNDFKKILDDEVFEDAYDFAQFELGVEATIGHQIDMDIDSSSGAIFFTIDRAPAQMFPFPEGLEKGVDTVFAGVQDAFSLLLDKEMARYADTLAKITFLQNEIEQKSQSPGNVTREIGIRSLNGGEDPVKVKLAKLNALNDQIKTETGRQLKLIEEEKKGFEISVDSLDTREKSTGADLMFATPKTIPPVSSPAVITGGGSPLNFQTNLIDATAGFIADRMKEELNVAFFEKFITVLNRPAFTLLFPTTRDLLSNSQGYNYSVMLQVIKAAFEKDLNHLPFNAPGLLRAYPLTVKTRKEAAYAILGAQVLSKVSKGTHPIEVINFLSENPDTLLGPNVQHTFQFLRIVSRSLQDTLGSKSTWIPREELAKMGEDKHFRHFYLGLLYKEIYSFSSQNKIRASAKTLAMLDDFNGFYGLVNQFSLRVTTLEGQLNTLKDKKGGATLPDALPFFRNVLGLVDFSLSVYLGEQDRGFQRFLQVNNSLMDIYLATSKKDYSLALVETLELLTYTLANDFKQKDDVLRYGSFMVALATANTSDEIKGVIKAMALPSGSYSIKRRNFVNISFNSYPGLTGGYELAFTSDSNALAANLGFTAPLGLAVSWGLGDKVNRPLLRPGRDMIPVPVGKRDKNVMARSARKVEPVIIFEEINDSVAISRRVDTTYFEGFLSLRVLTDSIDLNSYASFSHDDDTEFLQDRRKVIKRQARIKRGTKWTTRAGQNRYLRGASGSLFLSIIDLGAIVLFRLDNQNGALPQNVTFKQIFAPGISYVHGFRDLPLSLMVGTQLSPQLRKLNEIEANALRFNLALTVDIPIFNFYTRTER